MYARIQQTQICNLWLGTYVQARACMCNGCMYTVTCKSGG